MPIIIPRELPAFSVLSQEGRPCLEPPVAAPALKIGILNLMPKKIDTETQLLRQLSYSPETIQVDFIRVSSHRSKNTSPEHLNRFYRYFQEIENEYYDGFIITGAPIEQIPFEEVDYWEELCDIMAWSQSNSRSTFHICWGAQAGLYYHYGIHKVELPKKMFGIFAHTVCRPDEPILRDFPETFFVPHSRHTTISRDEILAEPALRILSSSQRAGIYLVADSHSNYFITGHSEYDDDTLAQEYFRDVKKGLPIQLPENYFIQDTPSLGVENRWSAQARQLYCNWVKQCACGRG